ALAGRAGRRRISGRYAHSPEIAERIAAATAALLRVSGFFVQDLCRGMSVARHAPARKSRREVNRKPTSAMGLVSRVTPVHTAMRNCTRDEGRPFGVGDQVADPKPPRAAVVKNDGGERCRKVGTMIPAGKVERGERKQAASEASKAD